MRKGKKKGEKREKRKGIQGPGKNKGEKRENGRGSRGQGAWPLRGWEGEGIEGEERKGRRGEGNEGQWEKSWNRTADWLRPALQSIIL